MPYAVSRRRHLRGKYPRDDIESEGGGNQTAVKPAALMTVEFSLMIVYQVFFEPLDGSSIPLCESQWNPCSKMSLPSPLSFSAPQIGMSRGTSATTNSASKQSQVRMDSLLFRNRTTTGALPGKAPASAVTDFIIVRDCRIEADYLLFGKLP